MKFLTVLSLSAILSAATATNLEDVQFLTALVGDFDEHRGEYILFLKTASSVPHQLTSLAMKVVTYTDDAYTTLLDNSNLDITQLKSFATELPWYARIAEAETASGSSSSETASSNSKGSGTSMMTLAGALIGAVAVLLL